MFAKTLIENTPKSHLKKDPSALNHPLVPFYNDYRSPSKYQVKKKQYIMSILAKTEICHFVHIFIFIINYYAVHRVTTP